VEGNVPEGVKALSMAWGLEAVPNTALEYTVVTIKEILL
jgi:hypothetical protein